jgi:hypothetical protein
MPRDTPVEKRMRADSPSHQHLSARDSVTSRSNTGLTDDGSAQAQPSVTSAEVHAVDDMDLTIITQYPNNAVDPPVITPTGLLKPTE